MCSTMRLIFNLYLTFNALFNIHLRIQHSTIHFIFNSLFSHSVIRVKPRTKAICFEEILISNPSENLLNLVRKGWSISVMP